jgi:hypothetical protein
VTVLFGAPSTVFVTLADNDQPSSLRLPSIVGGVAACGAQS